MPPGNNGKISSRGAFPATADYKRTSLRFPGNAARSIWELKGVNSPSPIRQIKFCIEPIRNAHFRSLFNAATYWSIKVGQKLESDQDFARSIRNCFVGVPTTAKMAHESLNSTAAAANCSLGQRKKMGKSESPMRFWHTWITFFFQVHVVVSTKWIHASSAAGYR